jgi:protein-S-isoprenylcysteine O-methyltransferase Ste14
MISGWIALIGVVVLLAIGCCWRSWLHTRRYGKSGLLYFQTTSWQERLRAVLGILVTATLVGQAAVTALRPDFLSTIRALDHRDNMIVLAVGALLLVAGLLLLIIAQLDLGASWRIGIDRREKPGLVTNGLYRFSRNPIFTAMLISLAGYAVLIPTVLSVGLLIGTFIGIRQQVLTEEAYLRQTYNEEYLNYARRVGRFLPAVGRLRD